MSELPISATLSDEDNPVPEDSPDNPDQQPDDTRESLIDVAIDILQQQGDHALRLADVAREANVAVSTIYAHFRDRTDLVASARLKQFKARADDAVRAIDRNSQELNGWSPWADIIASSITDPDSSSARDCRWDRLEAVANSRHIPSLATGLGEMQSTLTDRIVEEVQRAQTEGIIDPALDSRSIAVFIQVLNFGLAICYIDEAGQPDLSAWQTVASRITDSLRPTSAS